MLVHSKYYDAVVGRFINADGYVTTGQGIESTNMFAYCGNNPVNRADSSGMFWERIGQFFNDVCKGIKIWAKNTFSAGNTTTATIVEQEVPIVPDPFPITVKTSGKTTQTVSENGDLSKTISVYTDRDLAHPIKSSSVGLNVNISQVTLNINLALDDIGISGAITNEGTTNSFGLKMNLSELKIGFEAATAVEWDNTTETTYTNVSFSGWALVAAYYLITTGQPMPSPAY